MTITTETLSLEEATGHVRAFHDAFGISNASEPTGAIGDAITAAIALCVVVTINFIIEPLGPGMPVRSVTAMHCCGIS